ncbi:MAG TPA: sigma-70 family RNA polymerase sigma factor [Nevskiaceae bacterium]|nr:sigma-70 family RNA polymerase sigma factor [Nevskiaceae bacterium]
MNRPSPVTDNAREHDLLRRIAASDRAAFEILYGDYHRRLARFLTRLTRREDLIEEVINDTLWIVWQKAGEFRGSSLVSTWIMGIAYRCTLKSLRRAGGANEEPITDTYADPSIEQKVEAQERREWIASGLKHLPLEQRTTLELAYFLGHSLEEIAAIMDCPVSTVKARMFHARVKLRNLLPRIGGEEKAS